VHEIDTDTHHSVGTLPGFYHPTFLYELIWDFGVAGLVVWADRRFRLGRGRAFALYVMAYTAGRSWIEKLRIDHANHFLGIRLNDWTCMIVFAAALAYFLLRRGPREEVHEAGVSPVGGSAGASAGSDDAAGTSAGSGTSAGTSAGRDDAAASSAADDGDPPGPSDRSRDAVTVAAGAADEARAGKTAGEMQGSLTKENKAEPKQSHVDEPSAVGTDVSADVKSADADRTTD